MLFRTAITVFSAMAAVAAVPCSAQNLKVGLWEINSQVKSQDGQAEAMMGMLGAYMESMTPEQRAAIASKLSQNGVEMPKLNGNGAVTTMCVTPEMSRKKMVPMQTSGNCTVRQEQGKGGVIQVAYQCTQPKSSGEGIARLRGETRFDMAMRMTTQIGERVDAFDVNSSGRWVGGECGATKAFEMPRERGR